MPSQRIPPLTERNAFMLAMWRGKMTFREIGERFGVTPSRAFQVVRREAARAEGGRKEVADASRASDVSHPV